MRKTHQLTETEAAGTGPGQASAGPLFRFPALNIKLAFLRLCEDSEDRVIYPAIMCHLRGRCQDHVGTFAKVGTAKIDERKWQSMKENNQIWNKMDTGDDFGRSSLSGSVIRMPLGQLRVALIVGSSA
ncbi:LRRGT00045 [Rattus norvegicus]|uniref:LRRGT00045 n=2 Tax=Rattus norvegicus TaxID=10116 RepID=F7EWH8_RAT|nr:LRRGT00045 [Rattus norvegicus]EDL82975.1 LRRGT00045 [Rattus norvegicus]|eukprot:NP_001041407.1 uncharacterized protein LOC499541 [Rattus norvegicus]